MYIVYLFELPDASNKSSAHTGLFVVKCRRLCLGRAGLWSPEDLGLNGGSAPYFLCDPGKSVFLVGTSFPHL